MKFAEWAKKLPDSIDFIDYWYNLFLSKTKHAIETEPMDNINAFWINRWRNDFEKYVDGYKPVPGEGYSRDERGWFAQYMQGLVYGLQTPGDVIAKHFGKPVFEAVIDDFFRGHCCSMDWFVRNFVDEYGFPPGASQITKLHM